MQSECNFQADVNLAELWQAFQLPVNKSGEHGGKLLSYAYEPQGKETVDGSK